MLNRRESRQQAFEFLFEKSFGAESVDSMILCAQAARDAEISPYAQTVAEGVSAHQEEIDGYISAYSRARHIRRMSRVVLAALRLAIYEILYVDDLEPRISINEAIELVKKFGEKDEAGFVNGVLGGFMKAYTAGEIKPSGVIGAQTAKEAHSGKDGEGEAQ